MAAQCGNQKNYGFWMPCGVVVTNLDSLSMDLGRENDEFYFLVGLGVLFQCFGPLGACNIIFYAFWLFFSSQMSVNGAFPR